MEHDVALGPAAGQWESMTARAVQDATVTCAAIRRTVDQVDADCRVVMETLQALGDALEMFGGGGGLGQEWSGLGLISVPVMGAIKTAKGLAGQYVKQQTGIALGSWVDFVGDSCREFDAYLAQLSQVAEVAGRRSHAVVAQADPEQVRSDLELMVATQWKTRAWKQILDRVARLGEVVDAMLKVDLGTTSQDGEDADARPTGAPGHAERFTGRLQRQLSQVQLRTTERSGELKHWLLQPFAELRDRTRRLPSQTDRLARQISLLEILLDLETARLRVWSGEIGPEQARIVGLRVAAQVQLPELGRRLSETRDSLDRHRQYLTRLAEAHGAGAVSTDACARLREEYRQAEHRDRVALAALEQEADVWRSDGATVLGACSAWVTGELDLLAARRVAEQREPDGDRATLLQVERDRLAEVRAILATL
jgi:hypothetical protein